MLFFVVLVPPSISSKGGMITVVVNDPVRLECEASGVPVPSLTWLKEGSPVSSFSDGIQVCLCVFVVFSFFQYISMFVWSSDEQVMSVFNFLSY